MSIYSEVLKMPAADLPGGVTERSGRLWADVLAGWKLSPTELVVLENALRCLDRADAAAAVIAVAGMTVTDRYGGVRAHPLVDVEVRCRREFGSAVRQLGVGMFAETTAPRRVGAKPGPKRPLRSAG